MRERIKRERGEIVNVYIESNGLSLLMLVGTRGDCFNMAMCEWL